MQFAILASLFALSSSHAASAQFLPGLFPCGFSVCGIVVAGPGNTPPMAERSADCSSFLLTTVQSTVTEISSTSTSVTTTIPTTFSTTTLTTATAITTLGQPGRLVRRATVTPSVLPAYAIICNPSAYISACACMGVTGSTTTLDPTTTTTLTVSTGTITSSPTITTVVSTSVETATLTVTRI
ncbi:hypothetical protein PpBr36_08921 [Pyricularia pennisetigena]|uniref:hypothetical protein n=1 Tax=Pyricularia pennisetigena TaxID=1578925 RepID=UPI0011528641|nr:hypothetical protein PpBr36_08921 [Pyricularia pennisetigena]TLS24655.1 hypothetical protein PpBr36_08921 [Pyricularia pennisetigena]